MTGPESFLTKVMGWIGRGIDKIAGPDFERGLAKLESVSES